MSCETCGAPSGWVDGHRLTSANESKREALCVQRQQTQRIAILEQQVAELVDALKLMLEPQGLERKRLAIVKAALKKVKQP